jgi:type VI secretion system secreted protein Hcp
MGNRDGSSVAAWSPIRLLGAVIAVLLVAAVLEWSTQGGPLETGAAAPRPTANGPVDLGDIRHAMSSGSVRLFLRVPNILGESTAVNHGKDIDLATFDWVVNQAYQPGPGGNPEPGNADLGTLKIRHAFDRASPKLFDAMVTGHPLGGILLSATVLVGGATQEYLQIIFGRTFVSQIGNASAKDESDQQEVVDILVGSYKMTYRRYDAAGQPVQTLVSCWDAVLNSATCPVYG